MRQELLSCKTQMFVLFAIVTIACPTEIEARTITNAQIWVSQHRDSSPLDQYCSFNCDLWWDGDPFTSVSVSSPGESVYWLSEGEDQWGLDQGGSCPAITSEFGNGTYTFEATYADSSTESWEVELGGEMPDWPSNVMYSPPEADEDDGEISWDQWNDATDAIWIEIEIDVLGDDDALDANWTIGTNNTSFTIPQATLEDGLTYELDVYFVSRQHLNGFKASIHTTTFDTPPAAIQNVRWGTIKSLY